MSPRFTDLDKTIEQGRFGLALDVLVGQLRHTRMADPDLYDAYEAELCFETGGHATAARVAESCLKRDPCPAVRARLLRILALIASAKGDRVAADDHLDAAFTHCGRRGRDRALIELTRFNLALSFEPLETAMARLPLVRRIVTNVGDPHLLALLRVHIARAELRRRGLSEALRHYRAAIRLLERFPNAWLHGSLDLDASVGWMMMGDVQTALSAAQAALRRSEESGHLHTRLAAEVNLSHILERKGDFTAARKLIERVLRSVGLNRRVARAVRDSWANLLISSGEHDQARAILDETAELAGNDNGERPHWDLIAEAYSRARLSQAVGRWRDADIELSRALSVAEANGDSGWTLRLLANRCRIRAIAGESVLAAEDFRRCDIAGADPQALAEHCAALAALHVTAGSNPQALYYFGRARRIAASMGNVSLGADLTCGLERLGHAADRATMPVAGGFDSAVAILELAGHPHILGPEAFAHLVNTGCTEAIALVASGPEGDRVVEADGWTPSEARTAASNDGELLPVGQRGDEAWALLVRPRRDLDSYSAFAAIRRLLEISGSLDRYRREEQQRAALWPADALETDPDCVWAAEQMVETLAVARRIAPSPLSVLITGETGTGKEMLARAIHRASDRADQPFLPFNCTAVPRDMLESQLFGFRKGAFTGADTPFQGVIRSASGGTLFLDEIAEIGPDVQPKLLRFLESHEIHPLGEPHPIGVDVRVIAATNAAIEQAVAEGRFREDLFYRLNVVRLTLPPLRERREEIPLLVQHYLRRYGDELRKGRPAITDETLEYLLLFPWPGNVRQLANELRRIVALAEPDADITPALLSPEILASRRTIPAPPEPDRAAHVPLGQTLPAAIAQLEQLMIRRALDQTGGRLDDAARLLGISRKGLFLKRRRWGLETPPARPARAPGTARQPP